MAHRTPEDLGDGAWVFQASLWQTNSFVAIRDGRGLLCDPAYFPDEIAEIGAAADEAVFAGESSARALLATFAVEPPRANTLDFELLGLRASNARKALERGERP